MTHNPLPSGISTMSKLTIERKNLITSVNSLPDEVLSELANFLEYLHYKTLQNQHKKSPLKPLRPFGLCAGEFIVPDDFDAPLPEEILNTFEGQ